MLNRRTFQHGVAAIAATTVALSVPFVDAAEGGFILLTDDGEAMTCPLPPAETLVEVKLRDGSVTRSWFDCHIMDAGDWDFASVTLDGEYGDESIADQVIAWRKIEEAG